MGNVLLLSCIFWAVLFGIIVGAILGAAWVVRQIKMDFANRLTGGLGYTMLFAFILSGIIVAGTLPFIPDRTTLKLVAILLAIAIVPAVPVSAILVAVWMKYRSNKKSSLAALAFGLFLIVVYGFIGFIVWLGQGK